MKTLLLTAAKPRNPLAVAARRRRAGSHRRGVATMRCHAAQALRRELDTMKPSGP